MSEKSNSESFQNYFRLKAVMERAASTALRQIFLSRYQKVTKTNWEDNTSTAEQFLQSLCKESLDLFLPNAKQMIETAKLNSFDVPMLTFCIKNMDVAQLSSTERETIVKENNSIDDLNKIESSLVQLAEKKLETKDFKLLWEQTRRLLMNLGFSEHFIGQLKTANDVEDIGRKSGREKAAKMREDGNSAIQNNDHKKAIEIYSQGLLLDDLPDDEKILLYSNRSYAYLMSAKGKLQYVDDTIKNHQLALQDAEKVIEFRPLWWKGYFRAGLVYQFKGELELACDMFDQAVALNTESVDAVNCRDECRYDKSLVEIQRQIRFYALPFLSRQNWLKLNVQHGLKYDAETNIKKYDELLTSNNEKEKALACIFLGDRYFEGMDVSQDWDSGIVLLQQAADAGFPIAMCMLGLMYMHGKCVDRNIKKATALFEKAARCEPKKDYGSVVFANSLNYGITEGHFQIGSCYETGKGKPLNYHEAHLWYEKAMERGHAGAANNLGNLYKSGLGVVRCSVRAKQYWCLAASRGDSSAMDSLAWEYLKEKNFKQAKCWFDRAIEAGNIDSIVYKDQFISALNVANVEKLDGSFSELTTSEKTVENVEAAIECKSEPKVLEPSSRFMRGPLRNQSKDSPYNTYLRHIEDISKRSNNGHPFARSLFESIGYFSEGMEHLRNLRLKKVQPEDIQHIEDQCIFKLSDCLRRNQTVAFFKESELSFIADICKARLTDQKSDLDFSARILYSYVMTANKQSFNLKFIDINCQKYPYEPAFYRIQSVNFAIEEIFEAALSIADKGLKHCPKNDDLLFCKAGAMKAMGYPCESVIAAYKEYIAAASFDDCNVPEAYYNISFHCIEKDQLSKVESKMYYCKGLEHERNLLPCFIPYVSYAKNVLKAMLNSDVEKKVKSVKESTSREFQPSKKAKSTIDLQLTNPARLQFVLRHRETFRDLTGMHLIKSDELYGVTANPKNEEEMQCDLAVMKEITFCEMDPTKDQVYSQRFINLLVAEDPMLGIFLAIHVVVRDDNGDCLNCSLYNLNDSDETVRRRLCFGSRIRVLNPHYRLANDGTVVLRVDDPSSIIYNSSGYDQVICRFCWKENPSLSCTRCKRFKYCSRDCQTQDKNLLKHKLICGL